MCKADASVGVDDGDKRHPAELEQVDLLLVTRGDCMTWIRHPDEWQPLGLPIDVKRSNRVGAHRQYLGSAARELLIVIPQARQLRAAVRS